jgi:hypothetical protein
VRNGATTLFAAMNVLDGTVIGQNMLHWALRFISLTDANIASAQPRPFRRGA